MLGFAAVGAFYHWLVLRYGNLIHQGIDKFIGDLLGPRRNRTIINIFFFVSLGAILAVLWVAPATVPQALTAGMAWTTLFGHAAIGRHDGQATDA